MNVTLLHKYLAGECSTGEKKRVEEWLRAGSQNQEFMKSLQKIWDVTPGDEFEVDARVTWRSFRQRVIEKQERTSGDTPVSDMQRGPSGYRKHGVRSRQRRGKAFAYFFAAAAVMVIAFLFFLYAPEPKNGSETQITMQEIVTERGQRVTFRLSDGTRVQLNADSRLEIPGKFMDASRDVHLEGEAFFEVTHKADKPFIVHAGDAFTKVLGTKFGVRAYPEEEQVQVVVAEGKVALGTQKQPKKQGKHITRNQVGILSKSGQANVSDTDHIERYLGWKDGQLIFKGTPFREVKPQLERWYDISFTLADSSLGSRRLTASFNNEPMTEVLNVIALSMGMRYEREGREVTFQKNENE